MGTGEVQALAALTQLVRGRASIYNETMLSQKTLLTPVLGGHTFLAVKFRSFSVFPA